jgi:hypothetical protein
MRRTGLISARIARVYLDICLGICTIALPLLLLWLLFSPALIASGGFYADATVPVVVGESSAFPVLRLSATGQEAAGFSNLRLVKARGELRFETTSWWLYASTMLPLLVGGVLVIFLIFLVRQVVASVAAGDPFTERNATRLRIVGLILIVGGVVGPLLEYAFASAVLGSIKTMPVPLRAPLTFSVEAILSGLIILALSTVFGHGRELEDDKSLTI